MAGMSGEVSVYELLESFDFVKGLLADFCLDGAFCFPPLWMLRVIREAVATVVMPTAVTAWIRVMAVMVVVFWLVIAAVLAARNVGWSAAV